MPRKNRTKQPESPAVEPAVIAEKYGLTTAAELPEQPSHAERARPSGPRKRTPGEPFNVLTSADARIDRAGDHYEVTLAEKPDAPRFAQLQKWGLDDMTEHDTGEQWAGHRKELIKQGTDINHVAMVLAGKDEGRAR